MIAIKEIINDSYIVEKYTIKEGNKVYGTITLNITGVYVCYVKNSMSNGTYSNFTLYNDSLKHIFESHYKEYQITPVRMKGVKYPRS